MRRRERHQTQVLSSVIEGKSLTADTGTEGTPISHDLLWNIKFLKGPFNKCTDLVFHQFELFSGRHAVAIYIDGLSDSIQITEDILKPLQRPTLFVHKDDERELETPNVLEIMMRYASAVDSLAVSSLEKIVSYVLEAQVVLLVDGIQEAAVFSMKKRPERGVEEPATEAVIRGPREGFNENIRASTSLLRRRLRTSDFKIESLEIGEYTKTQVALCYIEGIIDPSLVEEVLERLQRIEIDGIIDTGYIEELIEDSPFSPFPQMQNTERPDVVASLLLEGRFAIIIDGSPFVILGPINLWGALAAAEDYYERYIVANTLRWLRYAFLGAALFLPALYVAITTYHQELLPTKLLISVAAAREVTPFPAFIEALIMEVSFEALREAGVRLPKTIGSSISIVGALIIGQAAVQAGIVSAPMVIIVSITGIASFCVPRYNFAVAIRLLRFPMIFLAGILGIYGIVIGLILITIHLSGLRSFGVPYLQPVSPLSWVGLKDTLIRVPRWAMKQRPVQTAKQNLDRQTDAMRPSRRVPQS